MNPKVFEPYVSWLFGRGVTDAYGVMLGVSFIIGTPLVAYCARLLGLPRWKLLTVLAITLPSGLLGARVFHILFDGSLDRYLGYYRYGGLAYFLARSFTPFKGGWVFYGALIGACAAGTLTAWVLFKGRREDILRVYDVAAAPSAMGIGVTRLGCFLSGCCFGVRCDALGVEFSRKSQAYAWLNRQGLIEAADHTPPLLPTQLAEGLFCLGVFVYLMVLLERRGRQPPLTYFSILMVAYASFRFVEEFFRVDPRGQLLFLSTSQWISLAVGGAALFVLRRIARLKRESKARPTST
ncbi:MAG: prolipoprotein diacylglyceryl transferase [Deltaproteobacteria bacterium]|nr:prolipoprotein diacylglyceryl transferase [Deltaproteobacteria bacterium]